VSAAQPPPARVIACVKPVALGAPRVERGQLVTEGIAWGLASSERRVVSAAAIAGRALGVDPLALAFGPPGAAAGLREALALGARRAVLVEAEAEPVDALVTAYALAQAVRRLGGPGLVLTGTASADAQQGLVGPMLAAHLGLELVPGVVRLEGDRQRLVAHRILGSEEERVAAAEPALLSISPRFEPAGHATSWGIGEAYALPLDTWPLQQLSPGGLRAATERLGLARAEAQRGEAERFDGEPDEAAAQLVRRWRAAGVVR
jgi:electron transfer flavoprotein beta subunit